MCQLVMLMILVAGEVSCGEYKDVCEGRLDLGWDRWVCGDKCIREYAECYCGNTILPRPYISSDLHCCSDEPCSLSFNRVLSGNGFTVNDGRCEKGVVMNMTTTCNGQCTVKNGNARKLL